MRSSPVLLVAALAVAFLIGGQRTPAPAVGLPPGGTFVDDNHSSQEPFIEAVYAAGITRGCNPPANDRYCPDRNLTRGQMAAFLVRAFGYTDPGIGDLFDDDDGSVFEGDIDRLASAGITKGCNPPSSTRYCPDDHLTRGQMAVFLTRALDLDPIEVPASVIELDVVDRETWGAQAAVLSLMQEHTVTRMTIHHAGDQTGTTGPARYRSWQAYHISRGWGDLAYHYIIGVDGTVYEGRDPRFSGATGTNYNPATHLLIVVEGNFDHDDPTPAQIDALVRTLAWAAIEFDVPPSTITGHRDHAATTCPGGNLYPYIASGDLVSDVAALLASRTP